MYIPSCNFNEHIDKIVFIRVHENMEGKNVLDGLIALKKFLRTREEVKREVIVMPVDKRLANFGMIYEKLMRLVEEVKGIERVEFNTTDLGCFQRCSKEFVDLMNRLDEENILTMFE